MGSQRIPSIDFINHLNTLYQGAGKALGAISSIASHAIWSRIGEICLTQKASRTTKQRWFLAVVNKLL